MSKTSPSKAAAAKAKAAAKPRAGKSTVSKASAEPKHPAAKSSKSAATPKVARTRVAKPKAAAPKAVTARKAKPVLVEAAPENDTLKLVLARLDDMKAEATVTIDLHGKSAYTDYMVVTTGRSNRHVGAVAENVVKGLKESGVKSVHVEGLTNCDWVLIDSGDVIVHVFRPEVREFYNLERMWTQPQSDAIAKPA